MQQRTSRRHYPIIVLLIAAVAVTFVPLLAFLAYGIDHREEEALTQEKLRLREHAETLVMSVDRELRSQVELARALTTNAALRAGDLEGFWRTARSVGEVVGGNFVLIDRDMRQVVNTRVPFGTRLPLTNNVEITAKVFATGEPVIGNLQPGAISAEQLFTIRVPVFMKGEVIYSLSYAARAGSILRVVEQSFRPSGWIASVLDGNGRFVARSLRHEQLYGGSVEPSLHLRSPASEIALEKDMEGRSAYVAYRRSPYSGWTGLIWAPQEVLTAPSMSAWRYLFISALLASAIAAIAVFVFNRLIRRPTLSLLGAAHQLGDGRPVAFEPTLMTEANVVGSALSEASLVIAEREHALREREQHLTNLLRELSHRTKNMLAVVQAISRRTARTASSVHDFQLRFGQRLAGLARSQDLLVKGDWRGVSLRDLVKGHLASFVGEGDDRFAIEGRDIDLTPEASQSIGMALHELATNALKHGAWSTPEGGIRVQWEIEDGSSGQLLRFRWLEQGGPAPVEGKRQGFGLTVIEKVAPAAINGRTMFEWPRSGLVWTLIAPLKSVEAPGRTTFFGHSSTGTAA